MDHKKIIILLLSFSLFNTVNAQTEHFNVKIEQKKTFFEKTILPISLIIGGATMSSSFFEKNLQRDLRNAVGNDFDFHIDDYTRYAPIVQMYGADILGVKSKSHWFDQTKNLTMSIIITDFITFRLKRGILKTRPNGGYERQSFPSGHASFAFTNAAVLYQEFIDSSPVLAYSGYAFAATTGTFRMLNNAHFLSDVLVSAGIGILVTELIYHFDPIIKWNPFKNTENIIFIPRIDREHYGVYFSMKF